MEATKWGLFVQSLWLEVLLDCGHPAEGKSDVPVECPPLAAPHVPRAGVASQGESTAGFMGVVISGDHYFQLFPLRCKAGFYCLVKWGSGDEFWPVSCEQMWWVSFSRWITYCRCETSLELLFCLSWWLARFQIGAVLSESRNVEQSLQLTLNGHVGWIRSNFCCYRVFLSAT